MVEVNFDKFISEYYDKLVDKGYHDNKKYILGISKIIKKGEKVLELGSGTGKILLELMNSGIVVEGLDVSEHMTSKLKSKNPKVTIHLSNLSDFSPIKEYDYTLSCNGPFSIKGNEIESYILEKNELVEVLKKYSNMAKKGILINIGFEKPNLRIDLGNDSLYAHEEIKIKDYTMMLHLSFEKDKLTWSKMLIKRRYKIKEILKGAKIKDFENFKLIKF